MALTRISQISGGVKAFFGEKNDRSDGHDEWDLRVYLSGDFDAFSAAVNYSRKHKSWKNHYWHISTSFTIEDSEIHPEVMRLLVAEQLAYYYPTHKPENLLYSAEAHYPKIQSDTRDSTGERVQRLPRFHNIIAKYDPITGNQVRMIPFNQKSDQAFQSYLCLKYGLVDPKDRRWQLLSTKRDPLRGRTKLGGLRKQFSQLVSHAKSIDHVRQILMNTGIAERVYLKKPKSGTPYLQVRTNQNTRNINLRGKGFECLESLYGGHIEQTPVDKQPDNVFDELMSHMQIWNAHRDWFIREEKKRLKGKESVLVLDIEGIEERGRRVFERYKKTHGLLACEPHRSRVSVKKVNAVTQAISDYNELKVRRTEASVLDDINEWLIPQLVIKLAEQKYGLLAEHYIITDDHIIDIRSQAKPKTVTEFLTENCHLSICEAAPILQELYQQQQSVVPKMDLSINTGEDLTGRKGWVQQRPKTFAALSKLIKEHDYAGFVGLKDDFRSADSVEKLGHLAIFDINNDPGQPQLSIAAAQALLSNITYLLVTTRNHQLEKVVPGEKALSPVDRYRVIVPITDSLSTDKDRYRLDMAMVAEKLGLDPYVDQEALGDIARQYSKSPEDAEPLLNNTKQALDTKAMMP